MQDSASKQLPVEKFLPYLDWIESQHTEMCEQVRCWANINSGSYNTQGLFEMQRSLEQAYAVLNADMRSIDLGEHKLVGDDGQPITRPLGKALHMVMRPEAERQVILSGHMDTVFPVDSPFQEVTEIDEGCWNGPGVADLKGGLVVMLTALQALERSPFSRGIGWQVLINSDEEIGSPGSTPVLMDCARGCDVGLIFEPSLPDGRFVSSRKGSGNLTVVARGRAAHVGREFAKGASAIAALSELMTAAHRLNDEERGVIVNIGQISGGGPVNVVPDLAICRLNIRVDNEASYKDCLGVLTAILDKLNDTDGLDLELVQQSFRPPKPFDAPTQTLFEQIAVCGELLEQPVRWTSSGGVCDGNILAAAGVPSIDTLGVVGAKIHTYDEYIELASLTQRAKLTALYLMRLGAGELSLPKGVLP